MRSGNLIGLRNLQDNASIIASSHYLFGGDLAALTAARQIRGEARLWGSLSKTYQAKHCSIRALQMDGRFP